MRKNDIEMVILVKNRPIYEYEHNDQVFVEGRAGSNYEIELRNHTFGKVEIILSVDGLSVIDGKEAGPNSRSYLVNPHATTRIPGWLLDSGHAAKFAFAGKQDSYASQTGAARNVGVIGALVYREKPVSNYPYSAPYSWMNINTGYPNPFNYLTSDVGVGTMSASATSRSVGSPFVGTVSTNSASMPMSNTIAQSLGTAFGDQTTFATQTVGFNRGDQHVIMSLFYDNLRGLRARGVPVERRGKVQHQQPNAFPGMGGCVPPQNWNPNSKS